MVQNEAKIEILLLEKVFYGHLVSAKVLDGAAISPKQYKNKQQ
jgi:hypothetical protein